jgi:hypothetical protein
VERSSLEERVAKIEGILEQMDKRLNHLESEIRDLRGWLLEFKPNIGYVNLRNHDVYLFYKGLPRHMTLVGPTSRS